MKKPAFPSREEIVSKVAYDPLTGAFTTHDGADATMSAGGGYRGVTFRGYSFLAHRLAWAVVYGHEPSQIDHVNGDKADNRIANLRLATSSENAQNKRVQSNNKTGHKGVSYCCSRGQWYACIKVHDRRLNLGRYDSPEAAAAAYRAAAVKHFGAFAR